MPPRYGRIPKLSNSLEGSQLLEALNSIIDEVNIVLNEIGVAESITRGNDGFEPEINTTLNMAGNRIVGVEKSRLPTDVVTRIELEELGLFTNDGRISFSSDVNFQAGVTATGGSTTASSSSLTTVEQVLDAAGTATEGLVATSRPGDIVSRRDDGVNGTTEGTLAMFVNGNGRADFAQVHEGAILTQDRPVAVMLFLILQELRRINGVSDNGVAIPEAS